MLSFFLISKNVIYTKACIVMLSVLVMEASPPFALTRNTFVLDFRLLAISQLKVD